MPHKLIALVITFLGLFIFTVKAEAAVIQVDSPCEFKYAMNLINPNRDHNPDYPGSVDLGVYAVPGYNGKTFKYQMCNSTKVYASISGTVSTDYDTASGNKMRITAPDGTVVRYLHLASYVVTSGSVKVGDHVATIGSTGDTDGFVHLHFNVLNGNNALPYKEWEFADLNYSDAGFVKNWEVAGDFSGDDKDDNVIFYDLGDNRIRLWSFISDGQSFTSYNAITLYGWNGSQVRQIASGDYDGDGLDDIVLLYDLGDNRVRMWMFRSLGNGTFDQPVIWFDSQSSGISWSGMKSVFMLGSDINGDNLDDVVIMYDVGNNKMKLWAFASQGNAFSDPSLWYSTPEGAWNITKTKFLNSGDYDGDGNEDLIAVYDAGADKMNIWFFRSNGQNAYSASKSYTSSAWSVPNTLHLTSGDTNNDGIDDAVMAYKTPSDKLKLWAFISDGTSMTPYEKYASSSGEWDFDSIRYSAMGDYDGNGYYDPTLTTKLSDGRIRLWVFKSSNLPLYTREVWHTSSGAWNI